MDRPTVALAIVGLVLSSVALAMTVTGASALALGGAERAWPLRLYFLAFPIGAASLGVLLLLRWRIGRLQDPGSGTGLIAAATRAGRIWRGVWLSLFVLGAVLYVLFVLAFLLFWEF